MEKRFGPSETAVTGSRVRSVLLRWLQLKRPWLQGGALFLRTWQMAQLSLSFCSSSVLLARQQASDLMFSNLSLLLHGERERPSLVPLSRGPLFQQHKGRSIELNTQLPL